MFFWTEQSMRWYCDAAQAGHFHRDLAALLRKEIGTEESVCDLGCGLGYLAAELAKSCRSVVAADVDENVLFLLRQWQIPNITVLCSDVNALSDALRWDTAVLCFFGALTEHDNLKHYLAHCNKRLIAVVNGTTATAIAPSGQSTLQKDRTPGLAAFLKEQGIPFRLLETVLEFGQPFATWDDAIRYICHYTPECTQQEAIMHATAQLQHLSNGTYYLPYRKKIGIFTIEKQEERT